MPGPAPVAARWSSGDDLPSTVIALPPAASRAPDEAPALLRPLDAAPPEPDASAMTVPVGMREIVFPTRGSSSPAAGPAAVQRLGAPDLGTGVPGFAALPGFATPAGVRGQEGRQDGEHAVGLPRHAPGPAFRSGSGSPSMPVVSRSAPSAAGRSVVAVPPVQRSPAPAAAPASAVAAPAITTVVQRVDGAAAPPTAAATGEGHSDTELDELARALFGRFRTQLRADVIHEREARGLTFDAF